MKKCIALLAMVAFSQQIVSFEAKDKFILEITYPEIMPSDLPRILTNKLELNADDLFAVTHQLDQIIINAAGPSKDIKDKIHIVIKDVNDGEKVYDEYIDYEDSIEFYTLINKIANKYDPLYRSS